MRVVAGKHRGRVLNEFKGKDIRPTADRAKEALFNILQFDIAGSTFLDLFSGTGSIGIEALSRGAGKVVFVDSSLESVKLIKSNLELLKEKAEVYNSDGITFLQCLSGKFDYIFIDPPYKSDTGEKALQIISERKLLNVGGAAVYEHDGDYVKDFDNLEHYDLRRYGIAVFEFYRMKI